MGFHKQLEVFEVMNFELDKTSLIYKSYKLENLSEQIKRGIWIDHAFLKLLEDSFLMFLIQQGARFDELCSSEDLKDNSDNSDCYKCKKCR